TLGFHYSSGMNDDVAAAPQFCPHPLGLLRVNFIMQGWGLLGTHAEPAHNCHRRFNGMCLRLRLWNKAVVKPRRPIVLNSDAFSPCETAIEQTGRSSVKIHDRIETSYT